MIAGTVNARREAKISLTLKGPGGTTATVEAVIDTGYTGFLVVSSALAQQLGLLLASANQARLADGSIRVFDTYSAEVEWDGQLRPIPVSTLGDEALIGMRLLDGYRLTVDVTPGGTAKVTKL